MNTVNTLKNNAYHVLGLDTEADQRKIQQRANEIRNRLKIDDLPEYDLDPGVFEDFRTEDSIREAIQRLGTPRGRIKEYFFWFQISDDIDDQALKLLKDEDYSGSIQVWRKAIEERGGGSYFYKKNLAVLYCLILSVEDTTTYINSSLLLWDELVKSSEFWKAFSQRYTLYNEQMANEELISECRNQVTGYLSDMYTEMYHVHKNADYISSFLNTFPVTGELMVRDILEPALIAINDKVEELGKTEITKETDEDEITEQAEAIQDEFNELGEFGLYDDSRTKVLRDKASIEIRRIGIDFYNKLTKSDASMSLLEVALEIAGTSGMEAKIEDDIKTLREIKEKEDLIRKYKETTPSAPSGDSKPGGLDEGCIGCLVLIGIMIILSILESIGGK